jgi:hypothetical protein
LANRCVVAGGVPVSRKTERLRLLPTHTALVSEEHPVAYLPPVAALGAETAGTTRWFLGFPPFPAASDDVESAFLVLAPSVGDGDHDIQVDVWTIHDAWTPSELRYRRHPPFGRPHAAGIARSRPKVALRIDVTRLVQYQQRVDGPHGFVITTDPAGGSGATFETGLTGGPPPILDVYVRR